MLVLIAQAAEPSPQGWAGTGEKIIGLAHSQPEAFWPVVACALPLLLVAGLAILVVRYILPAWREEKKADRDALVSALRQRGEEAERDATKDREVAKAQNEAIVARIEGKVDRVTGELAKVGDRVERHGEVIARLAAKAGVGLALLCAFFGGVAAGAGTIALSDRPAAPAYAPACYSPASAQSDDTAKGECVRKPCPRGWRCCGPERCCEIKESTASSPPLSALQLASLDNVADAECRPEVDWCL